MLCDGGPLLGKHFLRSGVSLRNLGVALNNLRFFLKGLLRKQTTGSFYFGLICAQSNHFAEKPGGFRFGFNTPRDATIGCYQNKPRHFLRVVECHFLSDHAAHGIAQYVCLFNAHSIHQGDCICSHISNGEGPAGIRRTGDAAIIKKQQFKFLR